MRGEHPPGARVELAFHQVPDRVHDGDQAAPAGQAAGGLQAEQPAAEHGDRRARPGRGDDPRAVVQRAERDHAGGQLAVRRARPSVGGTHGRLPVASTSAS